MRSCGDVILFYFYLKATLIILNLVLQLKYLYFLTEKKLSMQKNKVFTLGPVARGNCNSVNINSVTAVLLQ